MENKSKTCSGRLWLWSRLMSIGPTTWSFVRAMNTWTNGTRRIGNFISFVNWFASGRSWTGGATAILFEYFYLNGSIKFLIPNEIRQIHIQKKNIWFDKWWINEFERSVFVCFKSYHHTLVTFADYKAEVETLNDKATYLQLTYDPLFQRGQVLIDTVPLQLKW